MNAALTWTGPAAARPRGGSHRRRSRLGRWIDRRREESAQRAYDRADRRAAARYLKRIIGSAQPKRNAGKAARNAAAWIPVLPAVNWLADPGMHVQALLLAAFIWAGAAIIGGLW